MECEHQMHIPYVRNKTVSQSCVHVCMRGVCVCVGGGGGGGVGMALNGM